MSDNEKCPKCGSENVQIIKDGKHTYELCHDCGRKVLIK